MMSGDGGSEDEQPRKKMRGPYKKYLFDPSIPIPRSTLHSREKALGKIKL